MRSLLVMAPDNILPSCGEFSLAAVQPPASSDVCELGSVERVADKEGDQRSSLRSTAVERHFDFVV
jgi:hypothetical protein